MYCKNRKTSDPHRLSLNLTDKIKLGDKYVALSNPSTYYTWKKIKSLIRTIDSKYQLQNGMKNLFFEYILKKQGEETINPSIRIYINKIENRIMFKIKTGYYLEPLTPQKTKLFWSTKIKRTKN